MGVGGGGGVDDDESPHPARAVVAAKLPAPMSEFLRKSLRADTAGSCFFLLDMRSKSFMEEEDVVPKSEMSVECIAD